MMHLYDTRQRCRQSVWPKNLYVCGVTPYDDIHLGHVRVYVVFDAMIRYMRAQGHAVRYVRNITDIDDKIIKKAEHEGAFPHVIAQRYILRMHEDFETLQLLKPDAEPKVTEHIPEIIQFIQALLDHQSAYLTSAGNVWFRVRSFHDYTQLMHQSLDHLFCGARVDSKEDKEHPYDFALWKACSRDDASSFESPWGYGRPGWHIECSAMMLKHIGVSVDMHGGGCDLIFPHHTNELAQTESIYSAPCVKHWMHIGFVHIHQEKMSKSLGNAIYFRSIASIYHPEIIRYAMLCVHYRSPIDYQRQTLPQAWRALRSLYHHIVSLEEEGDSEDLLCEQSLQSFHDALRDDWNTPQALHALSQMPPKTAYHCGRMLGLFQSSLDKIKSWGVDVPWVEQCIEERNIFRCHRQYDKADTLRKMLQSKGIQIQDETHVTTWDRCYDES